MGRPTKTFRILRWLEPLWGGEGVNLGPEEGTRRESGPRRISEFSIGLTNRWGGDGLGAWAQKTGPAGSQGHERFQNFPFP